MDRSTTTSTPAPCPSAGGVLPEVPGVPGPSPSPDTATLRIGYVTTGDHTNPGYLSGMPYSAWRALARQPGVEIVPLAAGLQPPGPAARRHRGSILARIRNRYQGRLAGWMVGWPKWNEYRRTMASCAAQSRRLETQLADADVDALLGVCISAPYAHLETDLPIYYASDATWRLLRETYPEYRRTTGALARAYDQLERMALSRMSLGYFSSHRTLASAVEDYGVPRERARLLPLGANVTPLPGQAIEATPPGPDGLRLLVIAADPIRKRLDFCVAVAELLAGRFKRKVELIHVGTPTRAARRSPLVRCLGRLRLNDAAECQRLRQELHSGHFLLLPSMGEMFGIAPCEAAHFGRPSLVSDVGGLPTVVEHEKTGLVLPPAATPADYAAAIETLANDPEAYRRMSSHCLAKAQSVLNWDAWAATIVSDIRARRQTPLHVPARAMAGCQPSPQVPS